MDIKTDKDPVEIVYEILHLLGQREGLGRPATPYRLAQLISVAPSTVIRWLKPEGGTRPGPAQMERLILLHRMLVKEGEGNPEAKRIAVALLGAAGAAVLGFGLGGILVAAGLGWLFGDDNDVPGKNG